MLAPKSANALLAVVVLIVQGRMKLPGSFSLGDVLSNHLLATPTRVRGNIRKRAESFVLNRLETSITFPISLIAFSAKLPEKVVLRNSLKNHPLISNVASSGLLILLQVLLRLRVRYCSSVRVLMSISLTSSDSDSDDSDS
ncbi:hypothetical protein Tco_0895682 [Tanacetum coccineum]|uniref:Secreted protein n=1 Tax=Tanacetum coccineum TaxID=301880 RepID=A0ABQ5CFN2_9ASTR